MGSATLGRTAFIVLIVVFCPLVGGFGGSVEGKAAFSSPIASSGRRMLRVSNTSCSVTRSGNDMIRVDPLMHFEKYRGGYNLTNKHYWSSLIFTGVCGYTVSISWLVLGAAFGVFLIFERFQIKERDLQKASASSRNQFSLWPVVMAIFLTVLAIVAVGLVLGGSVKFFARASMIVEIITDTANDASKTIHNTTGAMKGIKDMLEYSNGGTDTTLFLMTTSQKLDDKAGKIERQAVKNRRLIDTGLRIVYIITTATICSNLLAIVALSVSGSCIILVRIHQWLYSSYGGCYTGAYTSPSFQSLRRLLYWLIALCWLLTALCWLFFGMYFFLDKFSTDTCTALDNFQEHPNNNSLSLILPCEELLSAKSILSDVGAEIYDLVNKVNTNISRLQTMSLYPNLLYVCNPFSAPPEYSYQPDKCPMNTIRIGDIPKVLRVLACFDPDNGTCLDGGFPISRSDYRAVEHYTTSVQGLLSVYPGMENLIECQSVKDAFSRILVDHCAPLMRYVQMVRSATACLAAIMAALVVMWTVTAVLDHDGPETYFSSKERSADLTKAGGKSGRSTDDS